MDEAERAVKGDETMTARVQMVKLQVLTAKVLTSPTESNSNGSWVEYKRLARKYKVRPSELQDLEPFIHQTEQSMQKLKLSKMSFFTFPFILLIVGYSLRHFRRKGAQA